MLTKYWLVDVQCWNIYGFHMIQNNHAYPTYHRSTFSQTQNISSENVNGEWVSLSRTRRWYVVINIYFDIRLPTTVFCILRLQKPHSEVKWHRARTSKTMVIAWNSRIPPRDRRCSCIIKIIFFFPVALANRMPNSNAIVCALRLLPFSALRRFCFVFRLWWTAMMMHEDI